MAQQAKDPALSLLGLGHHCGSSSVPEPGTFVCLGHSQKKRRGESYLRHLCYQIYWLREFLLWHSGSELTSISEDAGLIPGLAQWVRDPALP